MRKSNPKKTCWGVPCCTAGVQPLLSTRSRPGWLHAVPIVTVRGHVWERRAQEQSGIGDSTSWRIQWRIRVPWIFLRFLDLSGPFEVSLFFPFFGSLTERSEPWIIGIIWIYWRKRKRASGCFGVGGEPSLPPVLYLQFPNWARFAFFQLRSLFLFLFGFFLSFFFFWLCNICDLISMLRSEGLHISSFSPIYASSTQMVCPSIPQGYTANRWFGPTMVWWIEASRAHMKLAFKILLFITWLEYMVARSKYQILIGGESYMLYA